MTIHAEVRRNREAAPLLAVTKIKAAPAGEAMDTIPNGAGKAELAWVLNPANFKEARKILSGDHLYFFPKAAQKKGNDDWIPAAECSGDEFIPAGRYRGHGWGPEDHVVVVGRAAA